MAASDSSAQNVRFNLELQQLEFALGIDWTAVPGLGGTPAGADTQIQYNNSGAFGASADLTWDDSAKTLALNDTSSIIALAGATPPSVPAVDVSNSGALFTPEIDIWTSGANTKTGIIFGESTGEIDIYSSNNAHPLRIEFPGTIIDDTAAFVNPDDSAVLQLNSTTRGFLPPTVTTTQRDAISNPAEGLTVYNLTTHTINFWNGSAWTAV